MLWIRWERAGMIRNLKEKLRKKFKFNITSKKKKILVADMLLITSFFIIFGTTFLLNKYIAMYLLSTVLIILSYFIAREVK